MEESSFGSRLLLDAKKDVDVADPNVDLANMMDSLKGLLAFSKKGKAKANDLSKSTMVVDESSKEMEEYSNVDEINMEGFCLTGREHYARQSL